MKYLCNSAKTGAPSKSSYYFSWLVSITVYIKLLLLNLEAVSHKHIFVILYYEPGIRYSLKFSLFWSAQRRFLKSAKFYTILCSCWWHESDGALRENCTDSFQRWSCLYCTGIVFPFFEATFIKLLNRFVLIGREIILLVVTIIFLN